MFSNTDTIITLTYLILLHYFADFIFQPNKILLYRDNDSVVIISHCIYYPIPFLLFGIQFAVGVGAAHFLVDLVALNLTKKYWSDKNMKIIFKLFGLDQILHILTLIALYYVIGIDYLYYTLIKLV